MLINDQLLPNSISDDLVLISNFLLADRVQAFIQPGTPFLVADRTISEETIGRLYQIQAGTDILLHNVAKEFTEQCITQLKERGINHLNIHPHYPGIEDYKKDCSYIIVFGDAYVEAKEGQQIIDCGTRPLDIPTCTRIALKLGLYEDVKNQLAVAAVQPGLKMSFHLARQLNKIQTLTSNLQMILDQSQDGILLVDRARQIQFYNPIAKSLLEIHNRTSVYLDVVYPETDSYTSQYFVEIKGQSYSVEVHVNLPEIDSLTLLVIRDMMLMEEIVNSHSLMARTNGFVATHTFNDIIYESAQMRSLLLKCKQFAKSDSTVAIYGASGCGKELIAQAIHNASRRKNEAFVAVNFAALSPALCEAELFGYADGAFTGAKRGGSRGLFEIANHGTIFLDEIGDCPLDVQKKILRVIQERTVMPVGSNKLIPLDIRVIAATNQDLFSLSQEQKFREDLYYRLNVLPVHVPPLAERKDDIIPLFQHFMHRKFGIHIPELSEELVQCLTEHEWRGNVRELENISEYIANCIRSNVSWKDQKEDIFKTVQKPGAASMPNKMYAQVPDPNTTEILARLEQQHEPTAILEVLSVLSRPPHRWTRQKLLQTVDPEKNLSESSVKAILSTLKTFGLIQSKAGYGTYLTDFGIQFLHSAASKKVQNVK